MRPKAIAMFKFALIQVCHCPQANMWMRPHINPAFRNKLRWPHLIEEDERPNHLTLWTGQRAADFKPAKVACARNNKRFQIV